MKSSKFPTKIFVYVELNFSLKIKQRREKGVSLKALWRTFNNISLYRQYFRKYFLDFPLHSSSRTSVKLLHQSRRPIAISALFPPRLKKSLPSVLRAKYQKLVFSSLSRQSVSYFVQSNEEQRQTDRQTDSRTESTGCCISCSGTWTNLPLFFPPSPRGNRWRNVGRNYTSAASAMPARKNWSADRQMRTILRIGERMV